MRRGVRVWARVGWPDGRWVAGVGCVLCALCFAGVPPAVGAGISFGDEEGEGAGQVKQPRGIAVDNCRNGLGEACSGLEDPSVGDVYVADRNNNRIDKFGPNGEFLLAWGWGVADGKAQLETCGPLAAVRRCYAGVAGGGAGQFGELSAVGVAVDGAPGGSRGDVFVEDERNHRVEKFAPEGEFLLAWGEGVANGKEEAQRCGPEAVPATTECQAGVEPKVEGTGEGHGEFERLESNAIAAGSTGAVFVGGDDRVQEFSETGVFSKQVTLNGAGFIRALAVNKDQDVYVMGSELSAGVHEYSPAGVEIGEPRDSSGGPDVLALGPSDELFVGDPELGRILEFEAAGEEKETASIPQPSNGEGVDRGLAFGDADGNLYLEYNNVHIIGRPARGPLVESEEVTAERLGAASVRASIDPENAHTSYHLDYGLEEAHETETETAVLAVEGLEPETVEFKLIGLQPGASYHFHVVASNANGTSSGERETFVELPALEIEGESAGEVSATGARLEADINPEGSASSYHFQYGLSTAYEGGSVPVPDGSAGSGEAGVQVGVQLEDLTAQTTYHYRVVVENPLSGGPVVGRDRTFTTRGATSPGLIDGREWEMVSPPDKHGASLEMSTEEGGLFQAAEDGERITYFAEAPITEHPASARSFAYSQLLSTRGADGGWSTQDITTPQESVQGLISGGLDEYKMFSSDLSSALVEAQGATPLCPNAREGECPERTPYVRQSASGEFLPLLTRANVLSGVKYGGKEIEPRPEELPGVGGAGFEDGAQFVASTPDLSHVVLSAPLVLTNGFKAGFTPEASATSLYESSAGALELVSILPDEHPAAEEGEAASLGNRNFGVRNAIFSDGGRIVFETEGAGGTDKHLYMRDLSLERTVQLDAVQGDVVNPGHEEPIFVDATPDDSRIFFLDSQRLTEDASEGGHPSLYMCEIAVVEGQPKCTLKDLSVPLHAGENANVAGPDLGIDETGTYVYFVATSVLAPGASAGSPNLYVEDTLSGETQLVATLSAEDAPDWSAGELEEFKGLTSRVSANGRFVAFMSQRSLTGYDNEDATSLAPGERMDEEVFLYHAPEPEQLTAGDPGTLTCVSCDPTGARPYGVLDPPEAGGRELALLVDRPGDWDGKWLAGSLPSWPKIDTFHALYEPRNLDNDGRVFFDSADALVPQDVNGKEDVYEYEPQGAGGCALVAGCVGLISSGASTEESAFVDAGGAGPDGGEGEDVFFMTTAKLAPQDTDSALDVYDAHVCSAVAPCPSGVAIVAPACSTADSCRAAAAPQPDVFGAPSSATFSGPGNPPFPSPSLAAKPRPLTRAQEFAKALKACRTKRGRQKRKSCERTAHRRYGPTKAKKASGRQRKGR
jgi:hypothetical protein